MASWVLVVFLYAGMLADTDSMTSTTVMGFTSEMQCQQEGKKLNKLVARTNKEINFVCLQVK